MTALPGRRPTPPSALNDCALFLDFDGTLTPIIDEPDRCALTDEMSSILHALSKRFSGALAVISGRDIRDLSRRTPVELWRVGGHGLEVLEPNGKPNPAPLSSPDFLGAVEAVTSDFPGVWVEKKGAILAIHFRQAPEVGAALGERLNALARTLPDYRFQAGKMVFELKPKAANKGVALASLCARPPFSGRTPVMVGDDTTDEDGFLAAKRLGGFGVKVGEGETGADYALKDPEDVGRWLGGLT
ncbi:MAG: trehalose-phosphatase [Pseudomonadota bacterium]